MPPVMSDIFISYARASEADARRITEALRALDYGVWRDDELPAHRAYGEVIEERLKAAKAVVVLWSEEAVKSQWVRAEAEVGREAGTLVQLSLDGAVPPLPFNQIQCADLNGWMGDLHAPGWRKVVTSIADLTGATNVRAECDASAGKPAAELLLAVLPFDNLSTDPEMQFFSDGVSEEIIQRLTRGAKMKVIGRTSSFQFRGDRKTEAAQILKCSHVLDGSIRRAGGRVRIAAHLVEASSRTTLWSDRFDRQLEDIFAVQDEISDQISSALNQTFTSFGIRAVDPAVYDLYLRASPSTDDLEEQRKCITRLELVTQRAPDFAEAWAKLAQSRALLRFAEPFATRASSAVAVTQEAERALGLDADNPVALDALTLLVSPFGNFLEFEALIRRLDQAPLLKLAGIQSPSFVNHLLCTGFVRAAHEVAARNYRLDSLNPSNANILGWTLYASGRFAEAVEVLEGALRSVPERSFIVLNLLIANAYLKDWAVVDRMLEPAWLNAHPLRQYEPFKRTLSVWRDPTPENVAWLKSRLRARVETTGHIDVTTLMFASYVGLIDEAYQLAETAKFGPAGTRDIMGYNAYRTEQMFQAPFRDFRNDPRFVRLCARLGLVEFWMATQKWPDCVDEVSYDFKAECAKIAHLPLKQSFYA